MKNNPLFIGYLFIGFGCYFLIERFSIPFLKSLQGWPILLIIIGILLLFHSRLRKDDNSFFISLILLGFGIHLYGLKSFPWWINHWSIYLFIVALANFIRAFLNKKKLFTSFLLLGISMLFIFPHVFSSDSLLNAFDYIWPILLIGFGVFLVRKK